MDGVAQLIMPPMPFDHLSESAVRNLVRYLSSRPSPDNRKNYISTEDAFMSVHPSCGLSHVARKEFNIVCVGEWYNHTSSCDLYAAAGCLFLPDARKVAEWLHLAGGSTTHLHFDSHMDILRPHEF